MVRNSRTKASQFSHQIEEQNRSKKMKKPELEEHLEHIPFQLRAIIKSRERMKMGSKKLKKIKRAHKPKVQMEISEQEDIRVPHFRRGKQESEKAYLRRMSQETQHVFFLTKNQAERHPEQHLEEKATTSNTKIKKACNKGRRLHKKKVKQQECVEKTIFLDEVQFGEVAMAPPSLTVKPKLPAMKPKRASSSLLLSSLLGHTDVSTAKPSMARQKLIEVERERVVHAYRQLKRQTQAKSAAKGMDKQIPKPSMISPGNRQSL